VTKYVPKVLAQFACCFLETKNESKNTNPQKLLQFALCRDFLAQLHICEW
jgi:hypothetical protein